MPRPGRAVKGSRLFFAQPGAQQRRGCGTLCPSIKLRGAAAPRGKGEKRSPPGGGAALPVRLPLPGSGLFQPERQSTWP